MKDYASAIPIQISVYTNKLMIWNPGQLPPDWTVEKLLGKHSSQPFNPDIANAFFRSGMIESWGRGIERILAACAAAGLSAPEVIEEQTGLWMNFHFLPAGDREVAGERLGEKLGEKLGERLGETRTAIVKAMQNNPRVTVQKLAKLLGISTTAIENNIRYLKAIGYVRRIGAAKGGHWEVTE